MPQLASKTVSRRAFLRAGLTGAAAVGLAPLARPFVIRAAGTTTLVAEEVTKTLVDGTMLPVWQLRDPAGSGLGALPAALVVTAGDTVELEVENDLAEAIDLAVPGVTGAPVWIAPGGSRTVSFTAPTAGTYLAHGVTQLETTGEVARAMGLAVPLVVRPPGGGDVFFTGGPSFDTEYTLVYQDFDSRLNAAVDAGDSSSYAMSAYEPNYFVVNGLSTPDTHQDADTALTGEVGETLGVRLLVAGQISYPIHFHGFHMDVAARRQEGALSTPETLVVEKDTVQIEIGGSADVTVELSQAGNFPIHSHFVPAVTADGVYVNPFGGSITMLLVTTLFDDGFESGDVSGWS